MTTAAAMNFSIRLINLRAVLILSDDDFIKGFLTDFTLKLTL
jgi:hypothetical protein